MARTFVESGGAVTVAAPATVSSGDGVLVGALFGVASHDAAVGADLELLTCGVFDLPKVSGISAGRGARMFWDDASKHLTPIPTGRQAVAKVTVSAASGETTVRVSLGAGTPVGL